MSNGASEEEGFRFGMSMREVGQLERANVKGRTETIRRPLHKAGNKGFHTYCDVGFVGWEEVG